jgi:hypothetical protein
VKAALQQTDAGAFRMRSFSGPLALLALAAAPAAVQAQETTSSIRGVVTDGGAPVAGARVVVIHVPSGTTVSSSTTSDGAFSAGGLRTGGPFTVRVEAAGRAAVEVEGIHLTAGQPLRLPVDVTPAVGELVVTAARSTELSTGPISSFGREAIDGVASITRDVRDIARRDPFVALDPITRGISISGQNGRQNRFSVDGLRFSDNVGLNLGGLPTQRGPVPLDAIEQLSVKVAPYDVSEGDFQGGAVNVVLRSGNADYALALFGTYTSDKLTGAKTRGAKVNLNFTSENYGGFASGPLIEDKLFFAVSYETLKEGQPVTNGLAGAPNVVPNITQAQLDQISAIAQSRYGYDTLEIPENLSETDRKWTAKLDWNISGNQRASFTYIYNRNASESVAGTSITPNYPAITFASSAFAQKQEVN